MENLSITDFDTAIQIIMGGLVGLTAGIFLSYHLAPTLFSLQGRYYNAGNGCVITPILTFAGITAGYFLF